MTSTMQKQNVLTNQLSLGKCHAHLPCVLLIRMSGKLFYLCQASWMIAPFLKSIWSLMIVLCFSLWVVYFKHQLVNRLTSSLNRNLPSLAEFFARNSKAGKHMQDPWLCLSSYRCVWTSYISTCLQKERTFTKT